MKRILCFGDSNTWGAIPFDTERYPQDVRWPGIMAAELGSEYQIIEEGHNGRTTVFTDVVEERLAGIEYFVPCLDSQSPLDLIIIMLGTNDLKTRFGVDAYSIADGFRRYDNAIKTTRMAGMRPQVLLAAPILLGPAYKKDPLLHDIFGDAGVERSAMFAPAYEAAAKLYGWHFLNAAAYACPSNGEGADGLHMRPEGHKNLGLAMAAKVKEILG